MLSRLIVCPATSAIVKSSSRCGVRIRLRCRASSICFASGCARVAAVKSPWGSREVALISGAADHRCRCVCRLYFGLAALVIGFRSFCSGVLFPFRALLGAPGVSVCGFCRGPPGRGLGGVFCSAGGAGVCSGSVGGAGSVGCRSGALGLEGVRW